MTRNVDTIAAVMLFVDESGQQLTFDSIPSQTYSERKSIKSCVPLPPTPITVARDPKKHPRMNIALASDVWKSALAPPENDEEWQDCFNEPSEEPNVSWQTLNQQQKTLFMTKFRKTVGKRSHKKQKTSRNFQRTPPRVVKAANVPITQQTPKHREREKEQKRSGTRERGRSYHAVDRVVRFDRAAHVDDSD